ncbi:hypothetical protein K4K59_005239 [Colletotrichum sp. SAR11_240]|nr:hypothetical protein K4K59_005239 [Colletotrichum sp. SAR11_240]
MLKTSKADIISCKTEIFPQDQETFELDKDPAKTIFNTSWTERWIDHSSCPNGLYKSTTNPNTVMREDNYYANTPPPQDFGEYVYHNSKFLTKYSGWLF